MNHELARDLKQAGFPQLGDGTTYVDLTSKDSFYVPTLEELLVACTDMLKPTEPMPGELHFFELYPNMNIAISGGSKDLGDSNEWVVGWSRGSSFEHIHARDNYFGKTPNEAVARLWLAVKTKASVQMNDQANRSD
jgi:hypothetical protein